MPAFRLRSHQVRSSLSAASSQKDDPCHAAHKQHILDSLLDSARVNRPITQVAFNFHQGPFNRAPEHPPSPVEVVSVQPPRILRTPAHGSSVRPLHTMHSLDLYSPCSSRFSLTHAVVFWAAPRVRPGWYGHSSATHSSLEGSWMTGHAWPRVVWAGKLRYARQV